MIRKNRNATFLRLRFGLPDHFLSKETLELSHQVGVGDQQQAELVSEILPFPWIPRTIANSVSFCYHFHGCRSRSVFHALKVNGTNLIILRKIVQELELNLKG